MKKLKHKVGFTKEDKFIIYNEDSDLEPIKVMLPVAPDYNDIDGYNLPVIHQKFKRQIIPQKLVELQKSCEDFEDVWETLDRQRLKYKDEINWIKKQWYYRLNGYWFYNCGKPTYIAGWHYFYLNWFRLDTGFPEYRDRDRKFFIFAEFCYNDTKTFKEYRYDEKGKKIPNKKSHSYFQLFKRITSKKQFRLDISISSKNS